MRRVRPTACVRRIWPAMSATFLSSSGSFQRIERWTASNAIFSAGVRRGGPHILPPCDALEEPQSDADVLVIGCGSTGVTLAAQLAAFPPRFAGGLCIEGRARLKSTTPTESSAVRFYRFRTSAWLGRLPRRPTGSSKPRYGTRPVAAAGWCAETAFRVARTTYPRCPIRSWAKRVYDFYLEVMRNWSRTTVLSSVRFSLFGWISSLHESCA